MKFFKETHFDHADRSQPMLNTTSMKSNYYEKDNSGKQSINNSNNAYKLRHKIHDYGQIGS